MDDDDDEKKNCCKLLTIGERINQHVWFDKRIKKKIKELCYVLKKNNLLYIPNEKIMTNKMITMDLEMMLNETHIENINRYYNDEGLFNYFNSDIITFLSIINLEFLKHLQLFKNILSAQFNKKDVITFLRSFYDFYENDLVISQTNIIEHILSNSIEDSYIITINNLLLLSKYYPLSSLSETDVMIILHLLIDLIIIFNKIINLAHCQFNEIKEFINKCVSYALPSMMQYFVNVFYDWNQFINCIEILNYIDWNTIDYKESFYFREFRFVYYEIFISHAIKGNVIELYHERNYYHLLLSVFIDNYSMKQYNDINAIFDEMTILILIHIFYENENDVQKYTNDLLKMIMIIFQDQKENHSLISSFLKVILLLGITTKEDLCALISLLPIPITSKHLTVNDIHMNTIVLSYNDTVMIIRRVDMINFILVILNEIELIQKDLSKILLKLLLNDYSNLRNKSKLCQRFISNISQYDKETIDDYFMIVSSFHNKHKDDNFLLSTIAEDIKCIISSLSKCQTYSSFKCLMNNIEIIIQQNNLQFDHNQITKCINDLLEVVINQLLITIESQQLFFNENIIIELLYYIIKSNIFQLPNTSLKQIIKSIVFLSKDIEPILTSVIIIFTDSLLFHRSDNQTVLQSNSFCDFMLYYKEKYSLDSIILQNPLLIMFLFKELIKINKHVSAYAQLIDFIITSNNNNGRLLLKASLIETLLQSSKVISYDHIINIITSISIYLSRSDIEEIFLWIILQLNDSLASTKMYFLINQIITILTDALHHSVKIKQSITLTSGNINQLNEYNFILTPDISLSADNQDNIVCFYLSMAFYIDVDGITFNIINLNQLHNETDSDNSLIILLQNSKIIIKENNTVIFTSDNLSKLIRLDKTTDFLIEINRITMKISIWINSILVIEQFIKNDYDKNGSSTYMTGFINSSILKKENNEKKKQYHIVLLYYSLIYLGKLSWDIIHKIKLCKIHSGKMGSIRNSENKKFFYLSLKDYQCIAPSINKDSLKISIPIDIDKVSFEFIPDTIDYITVDDINDKNELKKLFCNMNETSINLKPYLFYIPYTNYKSLSSVTQYNNHSYLISFHDISQQLTWNNEQSLLSEQFYEKSIILNKSIDNEVRRFQFIPFIILLLHEVNSITNSEHDIIIIVNNLINLLSSYYITNLNELDLLSKENDFDSLIMVITKSSHLISPNGIEALFYLSYGINSFIKESIPQLHNPWYPFILTDLLLNHIIFNVLSSSTQMHLLRLVKKHIILNDFVVENYSLCLSILKSLLNILIMTTSNSQEITSMILSQINIIFKVKKGIKPPNKYQLNKAITLLSDTFALIGNFNDYIIEHLILKPNIKVDQTNNFIRNYFNALYTEEIITQKETIISSINKLNLSSDIQNRLFGKINIDKRDSYIEKNDQLVNQKNEDNEYINNISKTPSAVTNNSIEFTQKPQSNKSITNPFIISTPQTKSTYPMSIDHKDRQSWTIVSKSKSFMISNPFNKKGSTSCCLKDTCVLCKYIKKIMNEEIKQLKKFTTYHNMIISLYHNIFLWSNTKKTCNQIISQLELSFKWYLDTTEGHSRQRKRIISRYDDTPNENIDRTYYENKNNTKGLILDLKDDILSKSEAKFSFYNQTNTLNTIINSDQLFDLEIIKSVIDNKDTYDSAYNALILQGINYTNCIIVLGEDRMYIITNLLINSKGILYSGQESLKKAFWVIKNYTSILDTHCQYLNSLIDDNNSISECNPFSPIDNDENDKQTTTINKQSSLQRKTSDIISFSYKEINEIHKRRFLHHDNSIEIFLTKGDNYFIVFNLPKRDLICSKVLSQIMINNNSLFSINQSQNWKNNPYTIYSKKNICQLLIKDPHDTKNFLHTKYNGLIDGKELLIDYNSKWKLGLVNNYDYIMLLNTISGRSYNDLGQYPIFPWVINDGYTSQYNEINLLNPNSYRNYVYPIYVQNQSRRDLYTLKYNTSILKEEKYHSGSHYSNPSFVSYFLIRIKPYADISSEIQGDHFDTPDRLFFSIPNLGNLDDKYQELIPEIFILPEMYININHFYFGKTQNDTLVNDVTLPNWGKMNPILYTKELNKAIESKWTSKKINDWIDLIFGYKQYGSHGIEACNIVRRICREYDPSKLYNTLPKVSSVSLNEYEQEEKRIYQEMENSLDEICNMGQNPLQLFSKPHIRREVIQPLNCFKKLDQYHKEREYHINITTEVNDIKAYYEIKSQYISHGEGGLYSFMINDTSSYGNLYEGLYHIVGNDKILIGPSYLNYIDYSKGKYSFLLTKPYKGISYEYFTQHHSPIKVITSTCDGKYIIIGYNDGYLCKYKLKKNSKETRSSSKLIKPYKKTSIKSIHDYTTHIDSKYKNDKNISKIQHQQHKVLKNKSDSETNIHIKELILIDSSKIIPISITHIELCECYSLMIVVDINNYIYLYDLNLFKLQRIINYNQLTRLINNYTDTIDHVSICSLTGDFIIGTKSTVNSFNINGVPFASLYIEIESHLGNITSCVIQSMTLIKSHIVLLTGHETGLITQWAIVQNSIINDDTIDSYAFNYEMKYYQEFVSNHSFQKTAKLQMQFIEVSKYNFTTSSIIHIKINKENQEMIILTKDNKLVYLSTTDDNEHN